MVQIVNKPDYAEQFGTGLGQGLGQGLSMLLEHKINEVSANKAFKDLKQAYPLEDESRLRLAAKDPVFKKEFYKQQGNLAQTGEGVGLVVPEFTADQANKFSKLGKGVQNLWYKEYQQSPQQAIEKINKLDPSSTKNINSFAKDVQQSINAPVQPQATPGSILNSPENQAILEQLGITKGQLRPGPVEGRLPQQQNQAQPAQQAITEPVVKRKTQADYMNEGLTKSEAADAVKTDHKVRVTEEKEQRAVNHKIEDSLSSSHKSVDESDKRLNRMDTLIDKGGLPTSTMYNLLKGLEEKITPISGAGAGSAAGGAAGFALGGLPGAAGGAAIGGGVGALVSPIVSVLRDIQKNINPNQEEFEKLSNEFIKDAKAIFGNRITDNDLKAFMQTVPSLANTDHGKKVIIRNLKLANEATKIKYKEMQKIKHEMKNKGPYDLGALLDERTKDKLDALASQFVAGEPEQPAQQAQQEPTPALLSGSNILGTMMSGPMY